MKTWGEVQSYIRLHDLPYSVIRFNGCLDGRMIDTFSGEVVADSVKSAARFLNTGEICLCGAPLSGGVCSVNGCVCSPGASAPLRFVAIRQAVMRGAECVAKACSKTMAKRIANALNHHTTSREGV